jgi:hypothetical protein
VHLEPAHAEVRGGGKIEKAREAEMEAKRLFDEAAFIEAQREAERRQKGRG